jgi:hypothetical protein
MVCMGLLAMAVMANIEKRWELCLWIVIATLLVLIFTT